MGEKRLLVKSGLAGIFFTGLTRAVNFVYLILLARLFLPEEIGAFFLVVSVMTLVNIFSDLGVASILTRYLPYFEGKKEKISKTIEITVVGGLGLALITSCLIFVFSEQIATLIGAPEISETLRMTVPYLILLEIIGIGTGILNSRRKVFEPLVATFSITALKLILTVGLFYILGSSMIALILGLLLASLGGAIYLAFSSVREAKHLGYEKTDVKISEYFSLGRELFIFGSIVSILNFFGNMVGPLNQIMIVNFSTGDVLAEVAVFVIAISLGGVLTVFGGAFGRLLLPITSKLHGLKDFSRIRELTETATRGGMMLMLPPAIIFIVFSKELLGLLYGGTYSQGWFVVSIFVISLLIKMLSTYGRTVLTAMRLVDIEFRILCATFLVLVVSNILLIPPYGINGAALSILISRIVLFLLEYYYCRKVYQFKIFQGYGRVFLSALIIFMLFVFLKGEIWGIVQQISSTFSLGAYDLEIEEKLLKISVMGLIFILSFAAYFAVLFLLGGIGKDERKLFSLAYAKAMRMLGKNNN